MSSPDYDQFTEDHQCLLIVIQQIGPQMNQSLFDLIFERLTQLYEFKVTGSKDIGFERTIRLRFKQSYSIDNNNWGDFQAHRRLVGLITIARSLHDNELESICELHNTIRDTYANTLFDSRCFVIRNTTHDDGDNLDTSSNQQQSQANEKDTVMIDDDDKCKRESIKITEQNDEQYDAQRTSDQAGSSNDDNEDDGGEAVDNSLFDFNLGHTLAFASSQAEHHTTFSTHVNRSSSSSSVSSSSSSLSAAAAAAAAAGESSSTTSQTLSSSLTAKLNNNNNSKQQQLQTNSQKLTSQPTGQELSSDQKSTNKPSVTAPTSTSTTALLAHNIVVDDIGVAKMAGLRSRTHSRNKSLDSRLLSSGNESSDDSSLPATSQGASTSTATSSTAASATVAMISGHNRAHSTSSAALFRDQSSSAEMLHPFFAGSTSASSSMGTNNSTTATMSTSSSGGGGSASGASATNAYVCYESDEQCCEQIEARFREFVTGLFWVLESKRLDRASEKMDKIPLLMAPFEKKDFIGLDTDTRSFRRKCMGRMRKHIADLSLLAGLPAEALCNYVCAIDQLKACNDKLWLAAANEGLCASSLALVYPDRWPKIHALRRRFRRTGWGGGGENGGVFRDLISRCDYDLARREIGDSMRRIAAAKSIAHDCSDNRTIAKNVLAIEQYYERYKEAASYYAMYRGAAILEFECSFKAARTLIFFDRYLKAADFIQNAVFISFGQHNSTEEQIERLLQISQQYENICFYRKAAFYKRFAALKAISLHLKNPNWDKCYYLLLPALHSYGLTLDPTEYDARLARHDLNWSGIHVQLLQELITTAIKMQNETLAMRHLSFMLQCLFNHITPAQRQEFATKLSSLASRCGEGSPVILKLTNGAIVPSVNFTKFPTVIYFKVEPLAPYLRPVKLSLNGDSSIDDEKRRAGGSTAQHGPFIYTPLQLNRSPLDNNRHHSNSYQAKSGKYASSATIKMPFYWAEGNTGRITLSLHNYLPIEMTISSIVAMTDGVAFEPNHDTALKICATMSAENISLCGIPRAAGTLDILGYRIHTLGIKSDCALRQLPNARRLKLPAKFAVEVVPRLPLMCAQCFSATGAAGAAAIDCTDDIRREKAIPPRSDSFADMHVSTSTFLSLYTGQRETYRVKLSNISACSDELIDYVDLRVIFAKNADKRLRRSVQFEWDVETLNRRLPIGREHNIVFDFIVSVSGDFVFRHHGDTKSTTDRPGAANRARDRLIGGSAGAAGAAAVISGNGKKSQVLGSTKLANFINEFQAKKFSIDNSAAMAASKQATAEPETAEPDYPKELFESKMIEFCLQLDYSGGPGLNSGFCRQTSIHFVLEVMPSVLLTHWDVIPAEQSDECYLVFDALNATMQELNLLYAANKEMLIESREKCRIPVPIKRCPLNLYDDDADADDPDGDDQDDEDDDDDYMDYYADQPHIYYRRRRQRQQRRQRQREFDDMRRRRGGDRNFDFLSYIFPTDRKLKAILRRSRSHIRDQIDIRWSLPNSMTTAANTASAEDENVSTIITAAENAAEDLDHRISFTDVSNIAIRGSISVDKVPYSNEMLKSLLIPPIQSEITLDGGVACRSLSGAEVTVHVGEPLQIRTNLRNTSIAALRLLRLYIACYQDYQNSTLQNRIARTSGGGGGGGSAFNAKHVISGCDSLCIDQLSSGEAHEHECGFIFLYTGVYKLDVCCMPEDSYQRLNGCGASSTSASYQRYPSNADDDKRPLISADNNYFNNELLHGDDGDDDDRLQQQQQHQLSSSLFTCLHTIEITVIEE